MPKRIINRLERLDYLIRTKGSGTPAELANKLGISRSRLYDYISLLKERGAPISFSRNRRCFYYEADGRFCFTFVCEEEISKKVNKE